MQSTQPSPCQTYHLDDLHHEFTPDAPPSLAVTDGSTGRMITHPFPGSMFLDQAVLGLLTLAAKSGRIITESGTAQPQRHIKRLLARHAPAHPQAPIKPAA